MKTLLWPTVNVLILAGILFKNLKGPLKDFVSGRHDFLKLEVSRVEAQLKDAQIKFDEFSAKLRAIDGEISSIQDQARRDAEQTKSKIINESKRLAQVVIADAKQSAEASSQEISRMLMIETGNLVVDRIEALVKQKLTGEVQKQIRANFSSQIAGGAR